MEKFKGTDKR